MNIANPVDALFARASKAQIPMGAVCDRAGVARSTPSRWRHNRNGANLSTVRDLEKALSELIAERRAQPKQAAA